MFDAERYAEVSQALYQEAWLLDEGQLDEWLNWISPAIRYRMPTRFVRKAVERNKEYSTLTDGVAFFDEDYEALRMRVQKTKHRMSWTDNPASRTVRTISNIQLVESSEDRCLVRSVAFVYRSRFAQYEDQWAVRREDVLMRGSDGWKLENRTIYYPTPVLSSANLAVFF